jgi:hypothetical protein
MGLDCRNAFISKKCCLFLFGLGPLKQRRCILAVALGWYFSRQINTGAHMRALRFVVCV